jgi:ABC-2 type transport system permease protein
VLTIVSNFLPQSWQVHVDKWIPANAGSQIWTVVTDPTAHLFSAWTGFGVFVAYAAIAIAAGLVLFRKRDA